MSIKLHYLHSHLDKFPGTIDDLSEEQRERFHQDIRIVEVRYQCRWNMNITDNCLSVQNT